MLICMLILVYSTVRQCVSEAGSLTKVMPVTPGRRCAEQRGAVSDVMFRNVGNSWRENIWEIQLIVKHLGEQSSGEKRF